MSLAQHMGRATLAPSSRTSISRDSSPASAQPAGNDSVEEQYELVECKPLGCGAFGKVELVRRISDGQLFARKQMYYPSQGHDPIDRQYREMVETEIKIQLALTATGQSNITPIVDYWAHIEAPECFMVMEYCSAGSLGNLIRQVRHESRRQALANGRSIRWFATHGLPEVQVRQLLAQIVNGLHACHSYVKPTTGRKHPIIHCDLKPDNILLMGSKDRIRAKLADFGLAVKLLDANQYYHGRRGTSYYQAPEVLDKYKKCVSTYSDMYALGCILYKMCTLSRYIDLHNPEVEEFVRIETRKAQDHHDHDRC